jgi:hypothetical protein
MSDDDSEAQQLLDTAVNAGKDGAPAAPPATTAGAAETASPWDALGSYEDVKKRLEHARTWEKRAKENGDAAKRLTEIEESQKTEQQKLTDRLTAAEQELAGHRIREIRAQAARDAGLDADMAQFLTESEPDAALAQAKVLAKKLQPGKPDLRQGPRTTAKAPEDMNTWLRRATGHQRTP